MLNLVFLGRTVVHAVSRRPVTSEVRVRYEVILWIYVVDLAEVGEVFLQMFRVSPISIIPPLLHTRPSIPAAVTRTSNGRTFKPS
jgi:hypothetical protein